MAKFAVIESGGKQHKVVSGDKIKVEKLGEDAGKKVTFDKVLLVHDGSKTSVGTPYVKGASVTGTIVREARDKKKTVFRYHSKTRYRKLKGHRQHFTEVTIDKI